MKTPLFVFREPVFYLTVYMIQKILTGYGRLFLTIIKILLLLAVCALCACILVLPLWKLATTQPEWYSIIVLILTAGFILYSICRKIHRYVTAGNPDLPLRKQRITGIFILFGKIIIIASGITGFVCCVLYGTIIGAVGVLIAAIILYGLVAFGTKKNGSPVS